MRINFALGVGAIAPFILAQGARIVQGTRVEFSTQLERSAKDTSCCCKDEKETNTSTFCSNPLSKLSQDVKPRKCCKSKSGSACRRRGFGYATRSTKPSMCYPDINDCLSCVDAGQVFCISADIPHCESDSMKCEGDETEPLRYVQRRAGCEWHYDEGTVLATMVVGEPTIPPEALPEQELFKRLRTRGVDKLKYSSGIAMEGGGGRAYVNSIGTLKALDQLGFLKNLRYAVATSGASWAASLYVYMKNNNSFPEVVHPKKWTKRHFGEGEPAGEALFDVMERMGPGLSNKIVQEGPWPSWVIKHIFRPTYLNSGMMIAADDYHESYIRKKIKQFTDPIIVKPRSEYMPYFIAEVGILGPKKLLPFDGEQSFEHLECSSLYMGTLHSKEVQYKGHPLAGDSVVNTWSSGIVETYAFANGFVGTDEDWKQSIQQRQGYFTGLLEVNLKKPIRLLDVLAASSAAPAAFIAMKRGINGAISGTARKQVNIAQTTQDRESHSMMFGDGGSVANIPIFSLLQRKIKCIIALTSQEFPLDIEWAKSYVTGNAKPKIGQVDWSLVAMFGLFMDDPDGKGCDVGSIGCQVKYDQVFQSSALKDLLRSFIASHEKGLDLIHTMDITTVENAYWGIKAGMRVRMTFIVMTMSKKWEALALDRMKEIYDPSWTWSNFTYQKKTWGEHYGHDGSGREYEFPQGPSFGTTFKPMGRLFAGFQYQLAGWMIYENEKLIADALEHKQCLSGFQDDADGGEHRSGSFSGLRQQAAWAIFFATQVFVFAQ